MADAIGDLVTSQASMVQRFERWLAEIETRVSALEEALVKMSVLDPITTGKGQKAEEAKVSQNFEKYSEAYALLGRTKAMIMNGFRAARRQNRKLTARRYLESI